MTQASVVSHPADQIRKFLEAETAWHPCSAEYINYALALLIFAVRYPSVFWKTNKGIAFLFSVQLVGNGIQNLVAFSAMSIMYKVMYPSCLQFTNPCPTIMMMTMMLM